jgi:hypothetical protein
METSIKFTTRDLASLKNPQAVNCIDYFRKLFIKDLPESIIDNCWIAGGGVKDWFTDGKVKNDCDFFCVDRKTMATLVYHLRNTYKFEHFLITKNAIKGFGFIKGVKINIDVVKKDFQNAIDTLEKFDFTVCCFAVCNDKFYWHESAPFDLLKNRLVINALPHPVDTMKRMQKYIKKGFFACNGTMMTIAKAIAELDANDESQFEHYKFD